MSDSETIDIAYNFFYFGYISNEYPEYLNFSDTLPVGYNQPLDNLPNGLEYLKIDWCYDKPLNNLPEGLKILHLCAFKMRTPKGGA